MSIPNHELDTQTKLNALRRLILPPLRFITHSLLNRRDSVLGRQIVYCIGGSHNAVFSYNAKMDLLPSSGIRAVAVQGATIFGLANPNSSTSALPIFKKELGNTPRDTIITLLLGEIDCGFLIWLRSKQKGTSISDEMQESLNRYENFVQWIKTQRIATVIIISVLHKQFLIPPKKVK